MPALETKLQSEIKRIQAERNAITLNSDELEKKIVGLHKMREEMLLKPQISNDRTKIHLTDLKIDALLLKAYQLNSEKYAEEIEATHTNMTICRDYLKSLCSRTSTPGLFKSGTDSADNSPSSSNSNSPSPASDG